MLILVCKSFLAMPSQFGLLLRLLPRLPPLLPLRAIRPGGMNYVLQAERWGILQVFRPGAMQFDLQAEPWGGFCKSFGQGP